MDNYLIDDVYDPSLNQFACSLYSAGKFPTYSPSIGQSGAPTSLQSYSSSSPAHLTNPLKESRPVQQTTSSANPPSVAVLSKLEASKCEEGRRQQHKIINSFRIETFSSSSLADSTSSSSRDFPANQKEVLNSVTLPEKQHLHTKTDEEPRRRRRRHHHSSAELDEQKSVGLPSPLNSTDSSCTTSKCAAGGGVTACLQKRMRRTSSSLSSSVVKSPPVELGWDPKTDQMIELNADQSEEPGRSGGARSGGGVANKHAELSVAELNKAVLTGFHKGKKLPMTEVLKYRTLLIAKEAKMAASDKKLK